MDTQTIIMKGRNKYVKATWLPVIALLMLLLALNTCTRRPLEDDEPRQGAYLKVRIDWSKTSLDPLSPNNNGIHRVSLRFFPKDTRREVFDRYLEGNVTEGTILVPMGEYSVIVFNESVDDLPWWNEAITFTDVNSYNNFAANIVPFADVQRQQQFPFYKPGVGERFIVEPLHLASWSLDHFVVTEGMALVSQGEQSTYYISKEENDMLKAFTNIVMRGLTHRVNLTAHVENLASMCTGYMAIQGLASKVYMASAETVQNPATYLFTLSGRQYDTSSKNGTTSNRFLTFGRIPSSGAFHESYIILADILLINGDLLNPTTPLRFDVTNQFVLNYETDINIHLDITFQLPYVEGGIGVDDWEDEVITLE